MKREVIINWVGQCFICCCDKQWRTVYRSSKLLHTLVCLCSRLFFIMNLSQGLHIPGKYAEANMLRQKLSLRQIIRSPSPSNQCCYECSASLPRYHVGISPTIELGGGGGRWCVLNFNCTFIAPKITQTQEKHSNSEFCNELM